LINPESLDQLIEPWDYLNHYCKSRDSVVNLSLYFLIG